MTESVILLHGILLNAWVMRRLERDLTTAGFRVLNVDYPSRQHDLDGLVDFLHGIAEPFLSEADGPVHFIGHSMGGLIIRRYLARHPVAQLGRIVMLGTPNHGSEVADWLKDRRFYRWWYGPSGQQLVTSAQHPELVGGEVGVIAGNRVIDPVCSFIIGKENDGKVSVESTRLSTPHTHRVLPVVHTFMPFNRAVRQEALHFLQHGRFI